MKRNFILITCMVLLALLTGYLLSGISFIGRVGISLVYKEYQFLKVWWKGAILVFLVWLFLLLLLQRIKNVASQTSISIAHVALVVIGLAGLFLSYSDFHHTTSHRWLGERFHVGVYVFWLGWMGICIYSWIVRKVQLTPDNPANEEINTN